MRLGWKGALGIAVSAVLIWWTLRGVSLPEVWEVVRTGNTWLLAASVVVTTAGFVIRAMRWRVLLEPVSPGTTLGARFGAVSIGFMANNLLPARVGEFVRAYALSRTAPISMSAAFGTLVLERVLDGLVLLSFLVLPTLLPGFPRDEASATGSVVQGAVAVVGVVIVLLLVLLLWPRQMVRGAERVLTRVPWAWARRAVGALEAFLGAIQVVRQPGLLISAVLWSFAFWTYHGVAFYLAMLAFGIDEGFAAALFTEAAVGFGVALPSAPGFFGTFHAAADWSLAGVYGVPRARSLAFAYGFHLGGFIPITLIGLWYARKIGLSLAEMGRSEEQVEREVESRGPHQGPRGGEAPPPDGRNAAAWEPQRRRGSKRGQQEGKAARRGAPKEVDRVVEPRRRRPPHEVRPKGGPPADAGGPPAPQRKRGPSVEVDAPAKVNLALRVLDREPSGYHQIETLFQAIEMVDRIEIELVGPEAGTLLEIVGLDTGPPEQNLVVRAARAYQEASGLAGGLRLRLEKRIPPGTGLGGGSSDAAATLVALNTLSGGRLGPEQLAEIAAGLGADVPFFLCGSPLALGQGRGERLTPLPPLPPLPLVVAFPGPAVSTSAAYQALDRRREEGVASGAGASLGPDAAANWNAALRVAGNDFLDTVLAMHPEVGRVREAMQATAPVLVALSGSGSALFAIYESETHARRAISQLGRDVPGSRFVLTRTLGKLPAARVTQAPETPLTFSQS